MKLFRTIRNIQTSYSRKAVSGLFGIQELRNPEGFNVLQDQVIGQANDLVGKIVTNSGKNNVVPLFDELSNKLCKVADLAEFVRIAHPQHQYRACAEQALVTITNIVEEMNTDSRLYKALKDAQYDDELDEYVAKLFMFDFEQSAIHMDDEKKKLVLQHNESILKLGTVFAASASKARLVNLKQLPESVRHYFSHIGNTAVITGPHADSDNELVREIAYKIYLQPEETQNNILTNLLRCRLKLAQLCGFESYANRAVRGSIAGSPEVVHDFLNILNERLSPLAAQDYHQMLELKTQECGTRSGNKNQLYAWDIPYYSSRYKKSIHGENIMKCLPYFSVGSCMDGLNLIFNQLYGVKMQVEVCPDGELWRDDVIKLIIVDEKSNSVLGYIYCDLFEHETKQQQDCHYTIQGGCKLSDGSYQLPIVVLVLSLPKPTDDSPCLLSPPMVDNLFHEMGHAMHSMLGRTKYQHITGTRCSTDLAEVPSILMEFFASDPRVVAKFAKHHSNGQEIPNELLECWIKSKRVFMASETQLQVFYAALDQAYHGPDVCGNFNTTEVLKNIQKQYYSVEYAENTAWQLRFSHLVGYGAKYYSYLVSRAVASACWSRVFAEEPLSRLAGEKFKREVLVHGGGKPAHQIAEHVLDSRVNANFLASSVIGSLATTDTTRGIFSSCSNRKEQSQSALS